MKQIMRERGAVTLWTRLRVAGCSSRTTSCGTPATLRRSSARGAPSLRRRSASCPTCILATSPTPRLCQGPYEESVRYRDFMGWEMPWYSAQDSLDTLLVGRRVGMLHLVCYLRQGSDVFETYWTNGRGVEAMDNSYRLLDLTVYGRQESWEDSPAGWPHRFEGKQNFRIDGRPIAQWPRLKAGHSDDLGTGSRRKSSALRSA